MIHNKNLITQTWKEENILPFSELILSWNVVRPMHGKYEFHIRVKINEWSPWLLYASWGGQGQSSYLSTAQESPVRVYQDTLEILEGQKATGFEIKIAIEGDAALTKIHGLHVYTNGDWVCLARDETRYKASIHLEVPMLSQMVLNHPRHKHLCSPTSTTAVVRYLSDDHAIDPIDFAENVRDAGFDIFGNWVFNVAEASTHLGKKWHCWVEKLNGFNGIYQYLMNKIPVVVSVRGPLIGSAQEYSQGHLVVVKGYDVVEKKVRCMDPAFPSDGETNVMYPLADFLEAWGRRGNVAYVFRPLM